MFHGGMMSSVNITREEAQQRSQVITTHSSKVLVDLSGRDPNGDPLGERPKPSFPPQQFSSHRLVGRTISTLLLTASTPQTSTALHWIPPHSHIIVSHSRLSRELTRSPSPRCAATPIPGRVCTVLSTPPTARSTYTPSSKLLTPGACTRTLSSPTKR